VVIGRPPLDHGLTVMVCPYCTFAARARSTAETEAAIGAHVLAAHRVAAALRLAGLDPARLPADGLVTLPAPWRLRRDCQ
jgi:hypothetical protein